MALRWRWAARTVAAVLLTSCGTSTPPGARTTPTAEPPPARTSQAPAPLLMPDLIGLPSVEAGRRLGELEESARLDLSSEWRRPVTVRCRVRPGTVVRQHPAPGTPLEQGTLVQVRTAAMDLERFRGPCEPIDGDLGPVTGPDAALPRQFYRFAADPSLGAPFVREEVWIGIENGLATASLGLAERNDPAAWEVGEDYAERMGPFSALDIVAASGGYYELHNGVIGGCGSGNDKAPPGFAGMRAITLTAPPDVTHACMDWWGVTLFLDGDDRIQGVALRLGAP